MTLTHYTPRAVIAAAFASTAFFVAPALAQQDNETVDHTEIGSLSCDVSDGTGFIFGSTRELTCTFNPVQEGLADETYVGQIERYGIDVGQTQNGQMSWLVLAPTEAEYSAGALTGDYQGVSAEATLGLGLGANVMVGGSEDTLALQPVSLNTQNGVNFAIGVGQITLQHLDG